MIITRSPLRITLGGGGTDLPSYYKYNEGFTLSAAINKYVYINIHKTFQQGFYLKYSSYEKKKKIEQIKHPLIREALKEADIKTHNLEIGSHADIPAGTGLGSSASFTTALLKGLYLSQNKNISNNDLAELASKIEINNLNEPVGKQDQYIATYGGVKVFRFLKNGKVKISNNIIKKNFLNVLEEKLFLFFTGFSRKSITILKEQNNQTKKNNQMMIDNLDFVKSLGIESLKSLQKGNFSEFCKIMNEHWLFKKKRSKKMSNSFINLCYDYALKNGAKAGKVVGAGGGGFLMFYSDNKKKLKNALKKKNITEIDFKFDFEGTKILVK